MDWTEFLQIIVVQLNRGIMNNQTIIAFFMVCLGLFGSTFLIYKVKKDWVDMSKRSYNIVFIITIVGGWFIGLISLYRVLIDLKIIVG